MPDENVNPAWTAQIPQDEQVETNQTWDDFVLDFWEWENQSQTEDSSVAVDDSLNTEQKISEEPSSLGDVDFDTWDLFDDGENEKTEWIQENDIEIADKTVDDWKIDDFDISLEDNSDDISQSSDETENGQTEWIDLNENHGIEDERDENKDDIQIEDNSVNENIEDNTDDLGETFQFEWSEQKNEDGVVDEQEVENTNGDLVEELYSEWNEQKTQNSEVIDEKQVDSVDDSLNNLSDEKKEIEGEAQVKNDENVLDEDSLEKPEENSILDSKSESESEDNIKVSDNLSEMIDSFDEWESNKINKDEWQNVVVENLDVKDSFDLGDKEQWLNKIDEPIDEKFWWYDNNDLVSSDGEKIDQQDGGNLEWSMENIEKEEYSWWDEKVDRNLMDENENQDEIQRNQDVISLEENIEFDWKWESIEFNWETNELKNELDNFDGNQDIKEEDRVEQPLWFDDYVEKVDNTESLWNVNESQSDVLENQDNMGISFDSQINWQEWLVKGEKMWVDSVDDFTMNSEAFTLQEWDKDNNSNGVNDEININGENILDGENVDKWINDEKDQQTESIEMKSTLSLDEIMDSELQSGKFSNDNQKISQKVPSVTSGNDGKGRRILVVVAWIWMFLMAWVAAYLAFPDLLSTISDKWAVDVSEDQHSVAQVPEEYTSVVSDTDLGVDIDWGDENLGDDLIDLDDLQKNPGLGDGSKVALEFPDLWWDDGDIDNFDGISWDSDVDDLWSDDSEPIPNDWYDDGDLYPSDGEQEPEILVTIDEINNTIDSYREQGDWYYSYAQENSDNRVYKYATKVLSLCDEYENRISNWEWVDAQSYDSFKAETSAILGKLQGIANNSEIQVIETGNMPDDYDEEKQAERRDIVMKRANGEI